MEQKAPWEDVPVEGEAVPFTAGRTQELLSTVSRGLGGTQQVPKDG